MMKRVWWWPFFGVAMYLTMGLLSGSGPFGVEAGKDVSHRFDLAGGYMLIAQRKPLQQSRCLPGFIERSDVLQGGIGFTVPGDDHRFALLRKASQSLGCIGFEKADRLDLE